MKPVLVLYATRQGHAQRIADHLAVGLRKHGLPADVVSAAQIPGEFSLSGYSAAVLIASAHLGHHEREMIDFVRLHLAELDRIPTAFLSVSLSEAGAENPAVPPERRTQATADVNRMIEAFLEETGWCPARVQAVAGALLYSRYNFILRIVMKRIARAAGGDVDTSRDYEYTDWNALDRFTDEMALAVLSRGDRHAAPSNG